MKLPDIKHYVKQYRHLLTVQNIGLLVVVFVSLAWVWGSVVTLQKNYVYQRQVDANEQRIAIMKLQNQTYKYQQAYFKSSEYLEISARTRLNLALPGEHLVLLPPSDEVKDVSVTEKNAATVDTQSNLSRWFDFFFASR